MMEQEIESEPAGATTTVGRRRSVRWQRLALKELRETLRDRRTIVTLIVMPLLVYPILSLIFRSFLASNAALFSGGEPIVFQIAFAGDGSPEETNRVLGQIGAVVAKATEDESEIGDGETAENNPMIGALSNQMPKRDDFVPFRLHNWILLKSDAPVSIEDVVGAGKVDIGIVFESKARNAWQIGKARLISREDPRSQAALVYLQTKLELFNKQALKELLRRARLPSEPALVVVDQPLPNEGATAQEESGGFSLASLIPLILVLMTITGAVYPAIDLTAGEKERGTLETLMAAPLPRISILTGKFVAVMTVAVLTALLNMIGMATTVWVFQLDQFLTGSAEFTLLVVVKVFLLLVLFAAFFSALLLAVTSYARSFKEAQAYLIPIILLSMGPGLLAMTPGLNLAGPWSVTPMVNLLLLARDVIQNQVQLVPATLAIVSTLLYGVLAMMWAARSFGSDAILYQTHGSFGEMLARPLRSQEFLPLSVVVFCLVLLFPLNFVLIGVLGRMPSENPIQLAIRFLLMGVFTLFSFFLFPLMVASYQRASIRTTFGLAIPRGVFLVAALLLGISLWPLVMGLVSGWHDVYGWIAGVEKSDAWHNKLVAETAAQVARVRQVPPVVIALCLSIIPAVCEEWFFRGMLLRSLLRVRSVVSAVLISALIFGLFHVLSNSVIAVDRLLPTMLVGIVLGYLAYKSNSIWPGVLLHALHNAAVSFLTYYQPQLSRMTWFPKEEDAIPMWWIGVAVVVAGLGIGLIYKSRKETLEVVGTNESRQETSA